MPEFIGKKIKVEYVQKIGWRRPVKLRIGAEEHKVKKVLSRWEEHVMKDSWWQRKHRVHYVVLLDDGERYELYWNRGSRGTQEEWVLLKRLSDEDEA